MTSGCTVLMASSATATVGPGRSFVGCPQGAFGRDTGLLDQRIDRLLLRPGVMTEIRFKGDGPEVPLAYHQGVSARSEPPSDIAGLAGPEMLGIIKEGNRNSSWPRPLSAMPGVPGVRDCSTGRRHDRIVQRAAAGDEASDQTAVVQGDADQDLSVGEHLTWPRRFAHRLAPDQGVDDLGCPGCQPLTETGAFGPTLGDRFPFTISRPAFSRLDALLDNVAKDNMRLQSANPGVDFTGVAVLFAGARVQLRVREGTAQFVRERFAPDDDAELAEVEARRRCLLQFA